MGVNVVQLTEMYLASLNAELGVEPLVFSQFPVVTFGTTYSANSNVTDSSASGTALATGVKTVNNHLGLDKDDNYLTSIAVQVLNNNSSVFWTTSHSAGMVPTYALGVGQEKFSRKMDNTLIPNIIAETARYR